LGLWLAGVQPVLAAGQQDGDDMSQTQTPTAQADSTATADSTQVVNLAGMVAQPPDVDLGGLDASDRPLIVSWDWEPKAGVAAEVRRIRYWGEVNSTTQLDKGAMFNFTGGYSTEEFRKQDKNTQRKNANFTHNAGTALPVSTSLNLSWNLSEDRTVNSAGDANLNRNDTKRGSVNVSKREIYIASVKHSFIASASILDQQGESQRQRIDAANTNLGAGWQAGVPIGWGVTFATGYYRAHGTGQDYLGDQAAPSSSDEDSLRAGVYYQRGLWRGYVTVKRSNFDRRFLDYNRNTNGLVDTTTPGVEKIINELEQKDAVSYEWANQFALGPFNVGWLMGHDTGLHSFSRSGVGTRDRLMDQVTTDLSYRYAPQDSFKVSFGYLWRWDNQLYRDATAARGKQINKKRDFTWDWYQHLFSRTNLQVKYSQSLSQDTAENRFNENDRDRLETNASVRLNGEVGSKFRANMVFSWREVQDLSIRSSRSTNNNIKETYEVTPGYSWPLSSFISLQQNLLLSIQFTDYVFSELPQVSRQDNYNKRGTLTTKVTLRPSERLEVMISNNLNARFNATRTGQDAAGNNKYHVDLEQRINTIDLAIAYDVSPWLKLEGATYRTKDEKENFGSTNQIIDNRSGEIWLGGTVNKRWGSKNPIVLSGTARKFHAYGPNVQESNQEYWDANLVLSWQF
jgi:hypothetical protein